MVRNLEDPPQEGNEVDPGRMGNGSAHDET